MNTTVINASAPELEKIKKYLENQGYLMGQMPHSSFKATGESGTIIGYLSGKVVIQGKDIFELCAKITEIIGKNQEYSTRIGIDEAGKGDYFGPLVIGAVRLDGATRLILLAEGLRDSKDLNPNDIKRLSQRIMALCPFEIIAISPSKYNQLQDKFKNLNHLLAWGHAQALESLLQKAPAQYAISDQFGSSITLEKALKPLGRSIKLEQRPRAEEDLAVAAASVLARNRFVYELDKLSKNAGLPLPKGAGMPVDAIAKKLYIQGGLGKLYPIAKMHFKTTEKVTGSKWEYKEFKG